MRKAIFASDADLDRCKCVKAGGNAQGKPDELNYMGWKFISFHEKMLDSHELCNSAEKISERIGGKVCSEGHIVIAGHKLHLPAVIFGHDLFSLQHSSGDSASISSTTIALDAGDALTCWAAQHKEEEGQNPTRNLKIVQVPYAKSWTDRHHLSPSGADDHSAVVPRTNDSSDELNASVSRNTDRWDWTFTSDYCCTVNRNPINNIESDRENKHIVSARAVDISSSDSSDSVSTWQRDTTSGIDYDLLRARDVPILFYDEVVLYQDDLEDCGEVVFDAKLRVMPQCWFLLSRFFLRVDGSIVRIRDTRLFHKFGDKRVYMEVSWKEASLVPLGPNTNECSLANSSNSAGVGVAAAAVATSTVVGAGAAVSVAKPPPAPIPTSVLRNPAQLAEMLPSVNEQESIHKYFYLDL